ncbi:NADPH-dependent FMN reductase [Geomicrobium sp. JSM 1781026]|uniref:NADPH-dependent FMN reductase n=1 Tax=Geomicrobium sp. JSM 1781026 TaxID=3344580 RepID=UPI0035C09101
MKVVGISGSRIGSKTRTAMAETMRVLEESYPNAEATTIDLASVDLAWSDGRHFLDYEGDTQHVTRAIMDADVLIIGTPIFQASIPGSLKNVFDLLPERALENKTVSIVVTAGSPKHYLIAEQQLRPILTYMKANVSQNFVFIEEKDFHQKEIVNDDVHFRLQNLVEDTMLLAETYQEMLQKKDDQYDF